MQLRWLQIRSSPVSASLLQAVLTKFFLSAEEDFHQELARHLGLSFDEHKPSSDNMKFVKDISENAAASPAMIGKDNIAS